MTKPKLSFWQIWNLSFGFLGVQIGYSLQNSNTSSIFESLGADVSHLSYFWLAAPLAGMIVQPIVGLFSDGTWTRWGRRLPYILGGSLISALALVLMPNCPNLLAFAPLAMGAFILLFMDLTFNVTMQPFRALVADMLDDSQKTQGYVVQTFLINLGAVVGAILPLVMTWLGVSDEAAPGHVSPHIAYSYYAGGAILLLTVLVTSFKTREYPPGEFARYNNLSEEDAKPVSFVGLMRNVPGVMVRLGVTQFFSWAALFLMWTYLKPAITGVVTDHATGEVLSAGATQTWVGVLSSTYPSRLHRRPVPRARRRALRQQTRLRGLPARRGAGLSRGLCLLHDRYALMLPMVGIGIAWAGILAMPYAILSRAVEPRRMGVYMGIFNFTITVPQIVIGLTGGAIVKYCFASDAADMLALAGVFMLLAAVSVFLVKEHKAQ
ncbi:MAG: MFS transporter [Alistipes onderdonkii]